MSQNKAKKRYSKTNNSSKNSDNPSSNLNSQLQEKELIISQMENELSYVKKSLSFQLANKYKKLINLALPHGTFQRKNYDSIIKLVKKGLVRDKLGNTINFHKDKDSKKYLKEKKKFEKRIAKAFELGKQNESPRAWGLIDSSVEEAKKFFKVTPCESSAQKINRIAIVANLDLVQCNLYRLEQKKEQLKKAGIACDIINFRNDLNHFYKNLYRYNAVIFYRTPALFEVIEAINATRSLGIETLYDIDDLIFDNKFYPEKFGAYGGLISKEEYAGLKVGTLLFKKAIELCDYGITSTQPLTKLVEQLVIKKKSFVHRNALSSRIIGTEEKNNIEIKNPNNFSKEKQIKIFVSTNTFAHAIDFENLYEEPLIRIMNKYKSKVKIILCGKIKMSKRFEKYSNNFSIMPSTRDAGLFWQILKTMDINLSLITVNKVSDCKSEIKWMEAGYFEIPSILTPTENYKDVIQEGRTGFFVSSKKETFIVLDKLISNKRLREQVGQAAKEKILNQYNLNTCSANIKKILEFPIKKNKKKKVVVVNVFYPPYSIGGATRVVYDNVLHLKKNYSDLFDMEVITSFNGTEDVDVKTYFQDGVKVNAIRIPTYNGIDEAIIDMRVSRIFENLLDSTSPDLVHFHCVQRLTAEIVSVARVKKIPYIITVHDGYWISPYQFLLDKNKILKTFNFSNDAQNLIEFGPDYYLKYKITKNALLGAKKIIGVSKSFAKLYKSVSGLNNVIAIPNGSALLSPLTKKVSKSGKVRVAHIGGQCYPKGFFLFKEAIKKAKLKNIEVVTVNDSVSFKKTKKEVWGSTPVTVLPRVPFEKVNEIYENIDVLAAPSIWPESYGLVVREALNHRIWVITSDRGSVGEYVTKDNGFVISVDSIHPMISVLKKIDSTPEKYKNPINKKPKIRKPEEQGEEIAKLYQQILNKRD